MLIQSSVLPINSQAILLSKKLSQEELGQRLHDNLQQSLNDLLEDMSPSFIPEDESEESNVLREDIIDNVDDEEGEPETEQFEIRG